MIERASWVVPYTTEAIADFRSSAGPVVQAMHAASGLWDECDHGVDGGLTWMSAMGVRNDVGGSWSRKWPEHREVLDWVTERAGDPGIPLCGSSVHFDKRWLEVWFPEIVEGRTHRLPDPSGMRELLERCGPRGREIVATRPAARKVHRVNPDMDDTLAELRHYRDAFVAGATAAALFGPAADMCARPAGVCFPAVTA
jgi:oligoribonuclease